MGSVRQIENPQISIILNTRNRSKLLHRSISSALNQTFKDFELIIVDGTSTDNTRQVVANFAELDKRIKYLHVEENKSAAFCLNLGFKASLGKYIAILDDDDEFFPTKLEKQLKVMEQGGENLAIVYCWEEFWDDKSNSFIKYGKEKARGNLYYQLLSGPCTGGGTLMLIRKSAIEFAGGYDETIRFGADYQFNLNLSKYFDHDFAPEVLVRTHWNHQYVTTTTQPGGVLNYLAVIEYHQKILFDHNSAFKKDPLKRYYHFKTIARSYARLKKPFSWLSYSIKLIVISNLSYRSFIEFIAGLFILFGIKK